tara:strand:+ start:495 stop:818 length:324 start_codon:yes stop_codon:yes gene_type:complete
MATSIADGSQTAVISTEHTLSTITAAGSYVLGVDLSSLADGDELTLRIKTKVRSVGTTRTTYVANYSNGQSIENTLSVPIASPHEFIATLEQTDGTGRAFNWEVTEL